MEVVHLMKTNFRTGKSEVIEKYEGIPYSKAYSMAFKQKDRLNTESKKDFYWVKLSEK